MITGESPGHRWAETRVVLRGIWLGQEKAQINTQMTSPEMFTKVCRGAGKLFTRESCPKVGTSSRPDEFVLLEGGSSVGGPNFCDFFVIGQGASVFFGRMHTRNIHFCFSSLAVYYSYPYVFSAYFDIRHTPTSITEVERRFNKWTGGRLHDVVSFLWS